MLIVSYCETDYCVHHIVKLESFIRVEEANRHLDIIPIDSFSLSLITVPSACGVQGAGF